MIRLCDFTQMASDIKYLQKLANSKDEPKKSTNFLGRFVLWVTNTPTDYSSYLLRVKKLFATIMEDQEITHTELHLEKASKTIFTSREGELLHMGSLCPFLISNEMLVSPEVAVESIQQLYNATIHEPFVEIGTITRLRSFAKRYAMCAMASIIECRYPVSVFAKLIDQKKLDESEIDRLKLWVDAVEQRKTEVSAHLLHLALAGIIEGMYSNDSSAVRERNISLLEWRLYTGWTTLFVKDDTTYQAVVNRAIISGAVPFNVRSHTVRGRFDVSLPKGLDVRFYELASDENSLLMVGSNQSALSIWSVNAEFCARGCVPVKVKEVDEKYGYLLVERFECALLDRKWHTNSNTISPTDLPYLDRICAFISWLNDNYTPANLSADRLVFQRVENKVQLRALLPFDSMQKTQDFFAMVRFAGECAQNNRWVLKHLMTKTPLIKHPMFTTIHKIISDKLAGNYEAVTVQNRLNVIGITDPEFIDQITLFATSVKDLHQRMCQNLIPSLRSKDTQKELEKRLAQSLSQHLQEMGICCAIDPHLQTIAGQQAFMQEFCKKHPKILHPYLSGLL